MRVYITTAAIIDKNMMFLPRNAVAAATAAAAEARARAQKPETL